MEIRDRLPAHPIPPGVSSRTSSVLRVHGLVAEARTLAAADLSALPRAELEEPFACEEGWVVPGLRWAGVRLRDVLNLAGPLPEACYVRVASGEYAVPLPLPQANDALLCDELDGEPLPAEHGAPWRLVSQGGECFTSVKWVADLELTPAPGTSTGEQIARSRLRAS